MDQDTLLSFGLVLVFVLIGGVFAATELALVSLRESQLSQMEKTGSRGAKVAELARDPNRFLAAVQIGVTVAGFLSAAYGASTLAPDVAPTFEGLGLSEGAADGVALVAMTLLIAYLSLVFGELVPKRFALQKSAPLALAVAPPLARFATLMRPVIWLLSTSTNAVVRLLGGNPDATSEEMGEDELRELVGGHEGLDADERQILQDVFAATDRSVRDVMRPRGDVDFLDSAMHRDAAGEVVRSRPHSRYPVTLRNNVDDVVGFVHVRDLFGTAPGSEVAVSDVVREIPVLPGTNKILPALTQMRESGTHIALVVDEFGGTDGIVTLEDIIEELVGEIRDEHDPVVVALPTHTADGDEFDGSLHVDDVTEATGIELADGPYATLAGFVIEALGRIPATGDAAVVGEHRFTVTAVDGHRVTRVAIAPIVGDAEPEDPAPTAD